MVSTPGKPPMSSSKKVAENTSFLGISSKSPKKHNGSFIGNSIGSCDSRKTTKKFIPPYSQFTPKNFKLYLENDDYKEKLKYLKVKNENIKMMHNLQECVSDEKLIMLNRRKMIMQSMNI